ncbi:hypothetical protein MSPP1_000797 [Malassezia sp. CBS 17886]|nr:hypothetical protein MSPP1_000797 [Malassezia sp. CBS 17886]
MGNLLPPDQRRGSESATSVADTNFSEKQHSVQAHHAALAFERDDAGMDSDAHASDKRNDVGGLIHHLLHPAGHLPFRALHIPALVPSIEFPNQGHGDCSEFMPTPPIWVYYPFKVLYTVYFILSSVFVYLPCAAVANVYRGHRGRPSWSWRKSMTVCVVRRCVRFICNTRILLTHTPPTGALPRVKRSVFVWIEPEHAFAAPKDGVLDEGGSPDIRGELKRAMSVQGVGAARCGGYWLTADSDTVAPDAPARRDEKLLFVLHGGAYWMGSGHEDGSTAHFACSVLNRLSGTPQEVPRRAFMLEYRLAQHTDFHRGSFPAALLDTLMAYLYLTRRCGFRPADIVLVGESSGGNLALALCRYLRDEAVAPVPDALLLLSPWCDISRSHSGPVCAPNRFSTTVLNSKSDILDPSLLYRNTAVAAFIGNFPASETYTNAYMSPVSLHLDTGCCGRAPFWGFEGFPSRVYISTGSAEMNTEQHITLAHRMAQGTQRGIPVYTGDKVSAGGDVQQFAWRDNFPRSHTAASMYHRTDFPAARTKQRLEARDVVFDEEKDGVHVYQLFPWFEPERSRSIDRIVAWLSHRPIDESPQDCAA